MLNRRQCYSADDEPFEEKMLRLTAELRDLLAQADALRAAILEDWEGLG